MQKILDKNLITALVIFVICWMFSIGSSPDPKDWAFPLLANYSLLLIAIILFGRFIFFRINNKKEDILEFLSEDKASAIDVLVFLIIVIVFMLLMYGLGFWVSSLIMLICSSIYLTLEKNLRNVFIAIIVPIGISITAFLVFTYVFYVPFPAASWLPEIS